MNRIEFYSKLDKYKADKVNEEKEQNGGSLSHYGIIGQKWGTRRWQNADGTFNTEGKIRYFGKNGITKKNKEEKPAGKNGKDQKIGSIWDPSPWGDDGRLHYSVNGSRAGEANFVTNKFKSRFSDIDNVKTQDDYDKAVELLEEQYEEEVRRSFSDRDYYSEHQDRATEYRKQLEELDERFGSQPKDQKIGATGIYDIAAGVISVKNAINNYDDVQALRKEYGDFMKNSDQNYSDDERLSVLNNKKKIAKMQNALEFGDEKAYNKLLGKVKSKDKEAVEKFLKDLNQKNNELSKPDEDTAKKLEDSVFDERVGSLSKPKISRQYLKPDGTLNETGKRRTASNRKASDVASSVFLALRNFKLFELASLPVAGAALALSGFGVPAVLATALAGAIVAPSAAIDNTLYKKLEKRADAYYDMLNK